MKTDKKVAAALEHLKATGMGSANYAPPLHRLLWRFGFAVRPPHFASFGANFATNALFFAVVSGSGMWFLVWSPKGSSALSAILCSAIGGAIVGLSMAGHYKSGAARHELPPWKDVECGPNAPGKATQGDAVSPH